MSMAARLTPTARDSRFDGHQLSYLQIAVDAGPQVSHPGREFVPHNNRFAHDLISDGAVGIIVDI
jgi:hypothetical protein